MSRHCKHVSGISKRIALWDDSGDTVIVHDWWGDGYAVDGTCEYGNCVESNCPVCGCNKYGGWGPVECPCDDTVGYHEMRRKPKVAVKPSLRTNGVRRRRSRKAGR